MANSNSPLSVAQAALQRWYPSTAENTAFHLQQIYTALNDHNLAILSLNSNGGSGSGSSGGGGNSSNGGPTSITINNTSSLGGLGRVNLQSTNYALTNNDAGGLILVTSASPVTITCASAVTTPFFCFIQNDGTANVAVTPDSGLLINGVASLTIAPGFFIVLFFVNGTSWDAATIPTTTLLLETNGTPNSSQTLLNLVAGANVTLSESAGTVTIAATGGGGGGTKLPHDETASRSLSTTYQNTSGTDMVISGYCTTSGGGTGAIQALIGTVTPTDVIWSSAYTATLSSGRAGFNFYVPDGYFYQLNTVGGLGSAITGVGNWVEFW